MARTFDTNGSESLNNSSTPITAVPLSMSGWFNQNIADFDEYAIMWVGQSAAVDQYWCLETRGNTGVVWARRRGTGGQDTAETTTTWTTDGWYHAAAVFAANSDVAVYLDGGGKGTVGTSITPSGADSLSIGRRGDSSPSSYWSGELAEAGLWNVALTDAEVAALAAGASPPMVRPDGLVAYWPLIRNLEDRVGGYHLTATGTVVADHVPTVVHTAAPLFPYPVAGAPPPEEEFISVIPRAWHHRKMIRA